MESVRKECKKMLLTREELAKVCGVHPNTIDKWRSKGMPEIRIVKNVRFVEEDVLDWLKNYKESR